jgi:hypothetical protein
MKNLHLIQTAVEWFEQQLDNLDIEIPFSVFEEAKEMEKQQIIDAWENGYDHGACVNEDKDKYHGKQYFKQKFVN